jgi:hypothetical protein
MDTNFLTLIQITLGLSVIYVWIFRFKNVVRDFEQFGLNDLTRNFVGASKISLATLIIAGIWHPSLILFPALFMGLFMISAQNFCFITYIPFFESFVFEL